MSCLRIHGLCVPFADLLFLPCEHASLWLQQASPSPDVQIVDAVAILQAGNVVHFDLKPQNIYLEPVPGTTDADFWMPPTEQPTFSVIIGDFGESKMFPPECSSYTLRPLGTDFMKSPEMLRNGQHTVLHQQRENFDRRRHKGAGPPTDVWALACVLYQLIFGEMLFFDPDYFRFLQRIGFGAGPTIQQPAAGRLSRTPEVARLVSLMTERNQEARIDLRKVQAKLDQVGTADTLPVYRPAAARPSHRSSSPHETPCVPDHSHARALGAAAVLLAHPGMAPSACGAVLDAHATGTVQLTPSVLLGPAASCRCVSELSAAALQCIVVLSASVTQPQGRNLKGHWLDLAAALEVPCMHVAEKGMGVETLEGLQSDVQGYEKVLVVWEPGGWAHAAMVAVALAMQKNDMLCCLALTRLRRCTLFGKLSKDHISILHALQT